MATIDDIRWGAYVYATDSEGNSRGMGEWRKAYYGDGLAIIMTSQRKRPGKKFIRFFTLGPFENDLKYMTTDIGDVIKDTSNELKLKTSASIHTFRWYDILTEDEKKELVFSILAKLKRGGMSYYEWTKLADELLKKLGDIKIGNNDDYDNLQHIEKTLWIEE